MEDFWDASPQAQSLFGKPHGSVGRQAKYPWHEVPVGKCFTVPKATIKLDGLKSLAYKHGKRKGKRFVVIDHPGDFYEVARES